MNRLMKLILTVDEQRVGGIIADMHGRYTGLEIEVVELKAKRATADDYARGKHSIINWRENMVQSMGAMQPMTCRELAARFRITPEACGWRLQQLKKSKMVKLKGKLWSAS